MTPPPMTVLAATSGSAVGMIVENLAPARNQSPPALDTPILTNFTSGFHWEAAGAAEPNSNATISTRTRVFVMADPPWPENLGAFAPAVKRRGPALQTRASIARVVLALAVVAADGSEADGHAHGDEGAKAERLAHQRERRAQLILDRRGHDAHVETPVRGDEPVPDVAVQDEGLDALAHDPEHGHVRTVLAETAVGVAGG